MMIKGALFDIDDTLFSHKMHAVPSLTLKALDELRKKNIKIGVCTSRTAAEMQSIPQDILSRIDCQIMGTGAIAMVKDSYFKSYIIKYEDVIKYVEYFEDHNISYHYCDINGDIYFWGDSILVSSGNVLDMAKGRVMFKQYEGEEITGLFFYNHNPDYAEDIKNIKSDQYISWWNYSGSIGPELVDKSFGVLKFCQIYSFTTDEIIAFGDGPNDDVMLQMAGIGVAVKDSEENTKLVADYICEKSIEDGGIYEALVNLKIIEESKYDPKVFFFDNDGTIFNHQIGGIGQKDYEALSKLKAKGKKLVINTSRAYNEMYNVSKQMWELFDAVSMLSGAYKMIDGKVEIKYIDDDIAKDLIQYLDEHHVTYRYCTDDGLGYLNQHDPTKEQIFKDLYNMVPQVKKYGGERILHVLYYGTDEQSQDVVKICKGMTVILMPGFAGEVSPKDTDKGFVLQEISARYGIDQKDTCALGDGDNDVCALDKAGLAIALGNGKYSVKQAADYVTDTIYNDGVYKAFSHFKFI